MKASRILSLSYPDIDNLYSIITYPDGQRNIEFNEEFFSRRIEECTLNVRVKEFSDFEILSALIAFINRNDIYISSINFIYLMGMRSDRVFTRNSVNYFKDVIAPIINGWHVSRIRIFCPHSRLITRYVKNCRPDYFQYEYLKLLFESYGLALRDMFILGADESFQMLACGAHFKKVRIDRAVKMALDPAVIELIQSTAHKSILVIDDLCDGGRTFIEGAKLLKTHFPTMPLYLFVAHGLFTQGFDELLQYYDKIICTSSYREVAHPNVIQFSL